MAIIARSVLLALGLMLITSCMYLYRPTVRTQPSEIINIPDTPIARQASFWQIFLPLLDESAPDCPSPTRHESAGAVGFDAIKPPKRPDLIINGNVFVGPMQRAHDAFVQSINSSEVLKSGHIPGTKGIVSSAGSSYLPLFVTSLRMLRKTGSTLPVEVFVKDQGEYEKVICEKVLPSLNARCLVLSDILGSQTKGKVDIAHYQIKTFAVLFSSFEDVIWMDSDCFPLKDPEQLLSSEPFSSTGLVTWPDFWALSASPLYYDISRQSLPPMTSRASSETGVFLISKKSHFSTLLLAAYYNYYGPSHYFMLLSQGAPGEGDKETFIHAASALGQKFYTVSEPVQAIGHPKGTKDEISGSAMVQHDPRDDFYLTNHGKWRAKDSSVASPPPVYFIHAHYPKFNPAENLFGHAWETAPTVKPDGSDGRAWIAPDDTLRRFGYDAEKSYWEEIKWVSCNLENVFESWKRKIGICDRVEKYWESVFAVSQEDDPKFTKNG